MATKRAMLFKYIAVRGGGGICSFTLLLLHSGEVADVVVVVCDALSWEGEEKRAQHVYKPVGSDFIFIVYARKNRTTCRRLYQCDEP